MVLCFLRPPLLTTARPWPQGRDLFQEEPRLQEAQAADVLLGLCVNSMHEPVCVGELLGLLSVLTSCFRSCAPGPYMESWTGESGFVKVETSSSACIKSKLSAAVAWILT